VSVRDHRRTRLLSIFSLCAVVLVALGAATATTANAIEPGDLLVADPSANAILVLDTQAGTAQTVYAGSPLLYPSGIASAADGSLFIADPAANAIFVLNPGSGPPQVVSSDGLLEYPTGVALLGDGDLLVVDPDANLLVRIDPDTGIQSLELDLETQGFLYPTDLTIDLGGDYRIADPDANGIFLFDVLLRNVALQSGSGLFEYPSGVTLEGADLLVGDPDLNAIVRVESEIGAQTIDHVGAPLLQASGLTLASTAIQVPSFSISAILVLLFLLIVAANFARAPLERPPHSVR
jgi:hypothetical protein